MKRQRGRSRSSGGGGKPQHNSNRAFDSNGPEGVKVRGAAQTVYEKYQQLARDAHTAGDRVLAENHLQHAEHYFRVMRVMQPQRPLAEIVGRDQFVSGYDIDFEDESGQNETQDADGGAEAAEGSGERQDRNGYRRDDQRQSEPRQSDSRQNDRPNERQAGEPRQSDRHGDDRANERHAGDQRFADQRRRDDRPRDDRRSYERNGSDRSSQSREGQHREGQNRDSQNRDTQNRDGRPRFDRNERSERDPLGVIEPEATPLVASTSDQGAPTRNESGRAEVARTAAPFLRADDGEVSQAPAFLQARPAEPRSSEAAGDAPSETRRPRRRASPRALESVTADGALAEKPSASPAGADEA